MYFYPTTVFVGECRDFLSMLPDEVFDCVIWEAISLEKKLAISEVERYEFGDVIKPMLRGGRGRITQVLRSIVPYAENVRRLLVDVGTCAVVGMYDVMPYVRIVLDHFFGLGNFANEVIWAYSREMKPANRWQNWHHTVYLYAKELGKQYVNLDGIDRLALHMTRRRNRLVVSRGPEYAEIGRAPSDVWMIPRARGKYLEKYGNRDRSMIFYKRIIHAHSVPGSMILSLFDVTGISLRAAVELGRSCILVIPNKLHLENIQEDLKGLKVRYEIHE